MRGHFHVLNQSTERLIRRPRHSSQVLHDMELAWLHVKLVVLLAMAMLIRHKWQT